MSIYFHGCQDQSGQFGLDEKLVKYKTGIKLVELILNCQHQLKNQSNQ